MQTRKVGLILTTTVALLFTVAASAQNTMFLRQSPFAWMDDTDRKIMRATLEAVVLAPDGTVTDWLNPDTGSRGRIKVLDTHKDLRTTCRNIRLRTETKARESDAELRMCLAADGSWKFAPNQAD